MDNIERVPVTEIQWNEWNDRLIGNEDIVRIIAGDDGVHTFLFGLLQSAGNAGNITFVKITINIKHLQSKLFAYCSAQIMGKFGGSDDHYFNHKHIGIKRALSG